jgi:hypothetical protein
MKKVFASLLIIAAANASAQTSWSGSFNNRGYPGFSNNSVSVSIGHSTGGYRGQPQTSVGVTFSHRSGGGQRGYSGNSISVSGHIGTGGGCATGCYNRRAPVYYDQVDTSGY